MASEKGLSVDEAGFRRLMGEQRDRARADAKSKKGQHSNAGSYREVADAIGRSVEFTGYSEVVSEGAVRGIIGDGRTLGSAGEGQDVELVLDRTPFYAEGGGQLADQGVIELDNGARIEVYDVQSPITGLVVHKGKVLSGEVSLGGHAQALVDIERRRSISRSHTATHMVHKAFREALGETATQAGSENSPGRFRFDFSATGSVPTSAMQDVEARVNDLVMADLGVHAETMTQEEAVRSGAMALFGEKYGDEVRVISVGDWARELCGGTHAQRSGQLGVVKLLGESSIGSGVRRVEALVGGDAYQFLAREHVLVAQLSEALKVRPEQLPERVNDMVERLRTAEKEIEKVRLQQLLAAAGDLAAAARTSTARPSSGTRPRARVGATYAPSRWTSATASPATGRAWPRSSARPTASRRWSWRSTTRAVRPASRPTRWSGRPRRSSAARAAARTTSPRAVAPIPAARATHWPPSGGPSSTGGRGADGRRAGGPPARRTPRHRPGRRPDRGREQRPLRDPGDPGGDGGTARRGPRPAARPRRGAGRGARLRRPAALDVRGRGTLGR